jgi:hemolysin III
MGEERRRRVSNHGRELGPPILRDAHLSVRVSKDAADAFAASPRFSRGGAAMPRYERGVNPPIPWDYDRGETLADAVVHALGIAMAIGGGAVLIVIAAHQGSIVQFVAVAIYLAGLLAMFSFSAAYNFWPISPVKWWLRRFDHSAIYLLIAATYTAFVLPIEGAAPIIVLATVWTTALAGIAVKLFWPGRLDRTSIALYLLMGWSGIVALGPIAAALAPVTLSLIAAGGVLYSAGVAFHVWRSLRFQNAIWHGFVLGAALSHYAAVVTSLSA